MLRALPAVLVSLSMRVPLREGHEVVFLSTKIHRAEEEKDCGSEEEKDIQVPSFQIIDWLTSLRGCGRGVVCKSVVDFAIPMSAHWAILLLLQNCPCFPC
jgi:hypothetical protein